MSCSAVGRASSQSGILLQLASAKPNSGLHPPWLQRQAARLVQSHPGWKKDGIKLPQQLGYLYTLLTGRGASSPAAVMLAAMLAVSGGALHGVAMGLRKYYGEGHARYWLQWKWWIGALCDGIAGLMIWPIMPILCVEIMVPMVTVVQLSVGYLLGIFAFKEKATGWNHLGLLCAITGVVGLGLTSPMRASSFVSGSMLAHFLRPSFLIALLACVLLLGAANVCCRRPTFWASIVGLLEAIQFLCSRCLANALMHQSLYSVTDIAATVAIKGVCIVLILHCQQLGLEEDLSHFVGVYMVGTNFLTCILGATFFDDKVLMSPGFMLSASATLAGIWLLNHVSEVKAVQEVKDNGS